MLSLIALRSRIDRGELTPLAAIQASLQAIARRDPDIAAFVALNAEAALSAARAPNGPLGGIAVAVKDTIDTADMPTGMGSPIYAGWQPKADAAIVMRARLAGASILGKTTATPFAYLDPTETRNPHNPGHTPGGSSAGSAACVAAGMVPLAIGSQTSGSVIRPASFCGVAAIKPSFRLLPTTGLKAYSVSLDTLGLFAAGVADLAFALAALTGRDFAAGIRAPRLGVARQDFAGPADPACEAALSHATAALEREGVVLTDRAEPPEFTEAWALQPTLVDTEALAALAWEWHTHRAQMPPKLSAALIAAAGIAPAQFDLARRAGKRARLAAHLFFRDIDAAITFSAPGAAPEGLGGTGDSRFNRLWTFLGVPCVNVPGCRDAAGLPIGIQVVAPFGADATALAVAALLERALSRSQ